MTDLDDELAQATDELLSGHSLSALDGDNRELEAVLHQLQETINPAQPPGAAFEQRLNIRLNAEWDRLYAPPRLRLVDQPLVRVLAMAAAVVLILGVIVLLAVPSSSSQLRGTAINPGNAAVILLVLGIGAIGAFLYLRSHR